MGKITQEDKLGLLKDLLLDEDRDYNKILQAKIDSLQTVIDRQDQLSEKVNPIIDLKLEEFSKEIPNKIGPSISDLLKKQIQESRDEVVEVLYPILGQMVKKYIAQEIKILSEKIEASTQDIFSIEAFKRKVKSLFYGVKEEEMILGELANVEIEQIFIIEKGSGILLGSYQIKETLDQELISGMVTAIKSFVEEAFKTQIHNLESIEYDLYEIHLHSFHHYYIASAVSGTFTERLESQLENFNLSVSNQINQQKILRKKEALEKFLLKQYRDFKFE